LAQSSFSGIVLEGVGTHTTFKGAKISDADLSDSLFGGAIFDEADLSRSSLAGSYLGNASFEGAMCINGRFDNISGNRSIWNSADLRGCMFENANLAHAEMANTHLNGANFNAANFFSTKLTNANAERKRYITERFVYGETPEWSAGNPLLGLGSGRSMRVVDRNFDEDYDAVAELGALFGANKGAISEIDFTNAIMRNADLRGAKLDRGLFDGANLLDIEIDSETELPLT